MVGRHGSRKADRGASWPPPELATQVGGKCFTIRPRLGLFLTTVPLLQAGHLDGVQPALTDPNVSITWTIKSSQTVAKHTVGDSRPQSATLGHSRPVWATVGHRRPQSPTVGQKRVSHLDNQTLRKQ